MEVSCNTNTSARRCLDLLFQGIFFLFLLTPNRQVRINKMVNSISLKETSFHVSKYKLLRALSLSRMLAEFSLIRVYIAPCVGKIFIFMVFRFVENALNTGIFTHVPHHSKPTSKFLSSHPRQKGITHSPRQYFVENLFPLTAESGGGNYDLLSDQNSIRKYEDNLRH